MGKKSQTTDIESLYLQAQDYHQQGRCQDAIAIYSQIIRVVPNVAGLHYNLGLALYETGRFPQAAAAYRRASELNPGDPDIHFNLGLAFKKYCRYEDAEQAYLRALELQPGDADIIYNLGCCYMEAGETGHAREVFEHLVSEAEDYLPAWNNLAYLHQLHGEMDRARETFRHILRLDPDHASALHMLKVLEDSPDAAPPQEYIKELFDHYSHIYEENLLQELEYNLYLEMRKIFDTVPDRKRIYDHCLDLGCGTGLAGEAFRTACVRLTGVDLSGKMIEQAQNKEIYDHLHSGEIIDFLRSGSNCYDLFLAADVLIYRGDLSPLFRAAADRSTPGALFCFSTEKSSVSGWTHLPNGRYSHHDNYVINTTRQAGWSVVDVVEADIRREGNGWITGTIFVVTRS